MKKITTVIVRNILVSCPVDDSRFMIRLNKRQGTRVKETKALL